MRVSDIVVPAWVDPIKACHNCGHPIRLINARLEDGSQKIQIVDAKPNSKGWVRVWINTKDASVRRKVGTIEGQPYIPFKRHHCRPGHDRDLDQDN